MGYGKVNYRKDALKVNFFTNLTSAEAPNLLLPNPATGQPLQLNFSTQTYDFEVGDAIRAGTRQVFSVGGNVRRNNFDITIAPTAENRTELGAYVQDEIFFDKVRLTVGGRVDKFGNLDDPVFSPRLAAVFRPAGEHSVRVSFNRAFRSPSVINNYLDIAIVNPIDLRAVGIAQPFPLVVKAIGSRLPLGSTPQADLKEESITAYEVAYTGSLPGGTTLGAAFYVNDRDENINFVQLANNADPYTAANPPPGWPLPPAVLTLLASRGIFLPRTAFTYLNLGPVREKGIELSLDQRINTEWSAFANYSYQADPTVIDSSTPFPASELALPPNNRFNVGFNMSNRRLLASGTVNYTDKAFWADVLSSPFHGFTDAYTLVNGSFGVKFPATKMTALVKVNNILNKEIQQHVFGDIVKRSVVGELRFEY
jgi:outer membrane receptor protein involved in Fe transport